jgi:hypothetical protein
MRDEQGRRVAEGVAMSATWTEVNPKHLKLDGTGIELRQEDRPVPLPSGRPLFRSTPGSWSVYLDVSTDHPDAVYWTLDEAKAAAEAEAAEGGDA